MEEIIKEIASANETVDQNNKENRILYGKIYELKLQLKRLEMNATYGKEIIDQTIKSYAEFKCKEISDSLIDEIIYSSAGIEGWIKYNEDIQ